jgi:hypothetical protein
LSKNSANSDCEEIVIMMKRFLVTLVLLALVAVSVTAAGKVATGKITAIEGTKVTIALEGDRPDWVKKNAPVKFKVGPGRITETSAPDATPFTVVVTIRKAADMKVGEVVTFEKGLATGGC